jgi:hypothetical protein
MALCFDDLQRLGIGISSTRLLALSTTYPLLYISPRTYPRGWLLMYYTGRQVGLDADLTSSDGSKESDGMEIMKHDFRMT